MNSTGDPRLNISLWLSTTSGVISLIGSILIISVLLRSPKKLKSTYRRLVFGMSCMDIIHSLVYVASGLPVPHDSKSWYSRNAIGNIATCNIQGFMNYTGLMGSLSYACMLSIYFVMVIVYSKREDFIQKRIEPLFHAISVLIPFGLGIFLLLSKYFNGVGIVCWIEPYPGSCEAKADVECTRGEHASAFKYYFQYGPIAFVVLIFIACMLRLTYPIIKKFEKMKKYGAHEFTANVNRKGKIGRSMPSSPGFKTQYGQKTINLPNRCRKAISASEKSRKEIKQTFIQAVLYVTAMLLTLIFPVLRVLVGQSALKDLVLTLQNFFLPLLGFFNFFIFIRPRVVIIMQSKPELSHFQAIITAITAREVVHSSGKRASIGMTIRRKSLMGSHLVLDPVRATGIFAAEELKEEMKLELEDELEGESREPMPNTAYGLGESNSNIMPNDSEAQEVNQFSDVVDNTKAEAINMTDDYNNML